MSIYIWTVDYMFQGCVYVYLLHVTHEAALYICVKNDLERVYLQLPCESRMYVSHNCVSGFSGREGGFRFRFPVSVIH